MDFDKSKWLNTYLFTLSSNPIEEKNYYISLYKPILWNSAPPDRQENSWICSENILKNSHTKDHTR